MRAEARDAIGQLADAGDDCADPAPCGPFWTEQAYQRLRQIKATVDPVT